MSEKYPSTSVGVCRCGKHAFTTKAAAKAVIGRIRRREGKLHAYRCDHDERYWHIGHMPALVARGEVQRQTWVSKPTEERP